MIGRLIASLEIGGQVLEEGAVVDYTLTPDGMTVAGFPGVWPRNLIQTDAPRVDTLERESLGIGQIKYQDYRKSRYLPSVGRSVMDTILGILHAYNKLRAVELQHGRDIDGVLTAFGIPDTAEYENYYAYVYVTTVQPPAQPYAPSGLATVCWLNPQTLTIQRSVDGSPWVPVEHYTDFYAN